MDENVAFTLRDDPHLWRLRRARDSSFKLLIPDETRKEIEHSLQAGTGMIQVKISMTREEYEHPDKLKTIAVKLEAAARALCSRIDHTLYIIDELSKG